MRASASFMAARQRGQALILGLFVICLGVGALLFVFNTGQLVDEKTRLVNAADTVAYSGATMNARLLNFDAYANRAMLADTVAVAQLVSVASWIRYAGTLGDCLTPWTFYATCGAETWNPLKFPLLLPMTVAAQAGVVPLRGLLLDSQALERAAQASDLLAHDVLSTAERVAFVRVLLQRGQLMRAVAEASYRGDGEVELDVLPLSLAEDLPSFIARRSGGERGRFAELARNAAVRDGFVAHRSWWMPGSYANCPTALLTGRPDFLTRRGGTELIDYDAWRALDTLEEKVWVPAAWYDLLCTLPAPVPGGWGMQGAAREPSLIDPDPMHYDASLLLNPVATPAAQLAGALFGASWSYKGLPAFDELSQAKLEQDDPRLLLAVRLRRPLAQTLSSEGRSALRASGPLGGERANPAGTAGELVAVGSAEVYFARPPGQERGDGRELPSLFDPFWQVRLVRSDSSLALARALQGVFLP